MNKKSFVLLAAAMTGVTAVAVGAIAVSGANQMSKFSVNTSATNYTITLDADHAYVIDDYDSASQYADILIVGRNGSNTEDFENDGEYSTGLYATSATDYSVNGTDYLVEVTNNGYAYLSFSFTLKGNVRNASYTLALKLDGEYMKNTEYAEYVSFKDNNLVFGMFVPYHSTLTFVSLIFTYDC